MGNRGDVYERYYMPNFIDSNTLAIYLGTTRRDNLIQAVGHLERHEEAPDKLTKDQQREIWNDPEMVSWRLCLCLSVTLEDRCPVGTDSRSWLAPSADRFCGQAAVAYLVFDTRQLEGEADRDRAGRGPQGSIGGSGG